MNTHHRYSKHYRKFIGLAAFFIVYGLYYCYSSYNFLDPFFVIIIPSYNNEQWCERNITSVLSQRYLKKRVIFIDDCSSDGTYEKVIAVIEQSGCKDICTVIKNKQRCGALENIFYAIHSCDNHEIIALCDGDDWLPNGEVLDKLAHVYRNPDVWLTFGQFLTHPEGHWGICRPLDSFVIENALYRQSPWVTSHLRTFYAGLFKKIAIADLQLNGIFFDVTWDLAMLFPMLEMAAGRVLFIPDVMYIYNQANPFNDFKGKLTRMRELERVIRMRPSYKPLRSYL